jgi:hypothetical protein
MSYTPKKQLSASLYRRLAEAADGIRNLEVFFIAGYERPHAIKDFPDLKSAEDYFSKHGFSENDYAIWGPFKTTDDDVDKKLELTGVKDTLEVRIIITYKDNSKIDKTFPGDTDLILLNLSSFEKFAFPYYCHLYGVKYAKRLRDNLIAEYEKIQKGETMASAAPGPKGHRGTGTYMYQLYQTKEDPTSEELPD